MRSIKFYRSPAGWLRLVLENKIILEAQFVDEQGDYMLQSIHDSDDYVLLLQGTDFQIKVWQALVHVPKGFTVSYQQLAAMIQKPHAWRAVARAVAANKLAYFVPCHRVICKTGKMGGYRWGIDRKELLLNAER
jgi:AraC family transcriptional regulator of adaptative response/methylated-DNA-[protein]-cysteine methyltransferase